MAVSLLLGCGGGGGGGGSSAPSLSPAEEFTNSYGLAVVNADAAYAEGGSGAGVTVAVIDSGIDPDHPDLDANIHPDSADIAVEEYPMGDDIGHGTAVSGVIAAERNGQGMQGVAFNSQIMALRVDAPVTGKIFDSVLADAVNYAVEHNAQIINMSLGGRSLGSAAFRQAQMNATQQDVIIVAATGNAALSEPDYPARNAGDPDFNGLVLAVGAVDRNGTIASFSNWCGSSSSFCLVAPGVGVLTTKAGGGYTAASGTSFATPYVAGAAAVLIELWPNLSRDTVVLRLLETADDLGVKGVDPVYGHGLLNLEAALAPDGTLTVALADTASGASAALSATLFSLGPAFGDAMSGQGLLARAVALDDIDRHYPVDLSPAVASAGRAFGIESLLVGSDTRSVLVPSPAGLTLQMAVAEDDDGAPWHRSGQADQASDVEVASIAGSLSPQTEWEMGLGLSAGNQFDAGTVAPSAQALFWGIDEMANPHYALLADGNGFRLDQSLSESTTLSLGWFAADAAELGEAGLDWGGGNMIQASLDHAFADRVHMRVDVARVEESDTFLGSQTDGAFGTGTGAISHFVTVSGGLPITRGIEMIASYTAARTDIEDAGLLSDWDVVDSMSFGLGVVAHQVFESGDRIGILAGQPLRVGQAGATLTAPVGMTADETMILESERVDLSPSGRELNFQLAYQRGLWDGADVSSWLLMRTEPGHDADADNDYGVGVSFRMAF